MKFCRITEFSLKAARGYFIFFTKIIASILVLSFFSIKTVNAETLQDHGTFFARDRGDIPDRGPEAAGREDREASAGGVSGYRDVRVGLYENKPKIYTDEKGAAAGIFPTILEEVARKEKWRLTYVPCEWSGCLEALENGDIDLMPDVAFSWERNERFNFHTEEVVSSWSAVYVKNREQIGAISDLNGRRVAVLKASIQENFFEQMANGFGYKVTFIESESFDSAFELVADGSADAVISNCFFGDDFYRQYGLEKTSIVFNPVSLYFAAASDENAYLLKAIDNNLRTMKSEPGSIYYKALESVMERPPNVIIPRYMIWTIGCIGLLLLLSLAFIFLLRWQVRIGTKNLAYTNKMLRDSEKKFRDLFHQHAAVKLIINPNNGNIVEANEAAERFYGWSMDQLRQMRVQDINTLSSEQVREEMEKAKNLERTHFEFRHRLADGSIRDVAVFSSRINLNDEIMLHSIIHDITRLKQAEREKEKLNAQFMQAQKMESVGRLAGGVAHDYNNMLGVIIGYTELALQKIPIEDPLRKDLQQILNAAERSKNITRQLLAFARKETISPHVLDINATVERMLNILLKLIGEDIELTWLPGKDLWPVLMDPSQLDQMLANLCVNARDAITNVGKIVIETGKVSLDEDYCADHPGFKPGDFVQIAVSDNGCGMDSDTMDKIFEPFFTTKDTGKGTGLGLATVYGIVKQNNGFINVYSEPGQGTTFRIYLPGHEGDITEVRPEHIEKSVEGRGETVLVVEDEISILSLIEKILTSYNYRVLTARTPSEALQKAESQAGKIDLLITDVVLSEMNGRELAQRTSAIDPGIKCIYMSGYTADIIAHRGVLDRGFQFIQKPFLSKDLVSKVRETLDV
ncbi:MAG: transporter substrate-binding domain-containing protein [Deltaproteobacteria bacterium]|nr:transporter substrate-binding domain-containing protein [Deltaproteobacteria bacterium]